MRQIMENLLSLQTLQLQTGSLSLEDEARILKLRKQVPAAILARFDRLMVRGKKPVAITRNGACSECHLRLPSGTMAALAYTTAIHTCDNCGRYLFLPDDERIVITTSPPLTKVSAKPRARQNRKKPDLHVA